MKSLKVYHLLIFLVIIFVVTTHLNQKDRKFREFCLKMSPEARYTLDLIFKKYPYIKHHKDKCKFSDYFSHESDSFSLGPIILEDSNITDISVLAFFYTSYLDLSGNKIIDITSLASMKGLSTIDLSNNNISDITPLSSLANNVFRLDLDLSNNNISDITPLSSLSSPRNLNKLNLSNNKIQDASALSNIKDLSELDLSKNNIVNIEFLNSIDGLSINVDLSYNSISELKNLHNEDILILDLSHNKIEYVSSIVNLKNLHILDLEYNQLKDVSNLSNSNLTALYLQGNNLPEVCPLKDSWNCSFDGRVISSGSSSYELGIDCSALNTPNAPLRCYNRE